MDKDLIFFSAEGKGLTSTSANHVANMAKEMIRTLEARLAAMVFYSTEVSLIGSGSVNVLRNGADADDVKNLSAIMHRVAEAKSLIAWLREAIKAKDRLMRRTEDLSLEEFAKLEGIKIPEVPVMCNPQNEMFSVLKTKRAKRQNKTSSETTFRFMILI